MKELVRCRPCGYVMEADKLGDVCPACGLPRKVFEPYREKVSLNRLMVLNLDLHPIAIHFSQAFVGAIPLLFLFTALFPNFYAEELTTVNLVMIVTLPVMMIVALLSGMIDGYTRFKTFNTPLLIRKIVLSGVITILSGIASVLVIKDGLNPGNTYIVILLIIGCLACAVTLGLLGKKLLNVILPGKIFFFWEAKAKELKEKRAARDQVEN
ncbi:MAG: rubrerythrin [Clostridia bacterium]|nr:rubrerythrin [Clostridia bacterium]